MSLEVPVQPLNSVRVLDPRITINDQANKTFGIYTGPGMNTYKTVVSTSFSNQSITYDCNPPSANTYINRKFYTQVQFQLTFTGTSTAGNVLLQGPGLPTSNGLLTPGNVSYLNAPRAYPLSQICSSMQIQLGNCVISSNINTYQRALMRYMNLVDSRNLDLSMTPAMLDQHFTYFDPAGSQSPIQYSNRNPLGSFSANPHEEPRGSFIGCEVVSNTATSAVVLLTVVEPFWLSPMIYERGDEAVSFINLNNMQIQLNLSARNGADISNGLWSTGVDPTLSTITNISTEVLGATALFNYLTPQLSQSIPRVTFYQYYEPINYVTGFTSPLSAGESTQLQMNSVQFNSIPNRVYIFISDRDSNFNYTKTDTFLTINSINVTWENIDGLLNNASIYDLYQISVRNGCNMSFRQWSYDCGSVLCLSMGTDIPLTNLSAPSLRGQFNWSFQINVTNQTNSTVTPQINCVVIQEGVMSIDNNQVIRSVGVLSQQDVLNAIENANVMPYKSPRTVYGGLSFSDIKNFFRNKLPGLLRKGVNLAAQVAPAQYKPLIGFADESLKLIGHGRRRVGRPRGTRRRARGGAMLSRAELEDLLD